MSYQIQEFKVNDTSAYLTGVDFTLDENKNTNQPASCKSVNNKISEIGSYVENPEYVRAYTDADGRFLWGIRHDGSLEFVKGVPTPIKNYIVEFVINRLDNVIIPEIEALKESHEQYLKESENLEYARVIVDVEGKILWGIRQDGSVEFTKGVPTSIKTYIDSIYKNNDEEVERINQIVISLLSDVKVLTDTYHYVSNSEWVCAIVDSEEHILMGIKTDGNYYIPNRDMYHIISNPEWIKAVVDNEGKILIGIKQDGTTFIGKAKFLDSISLIENFMDYFSSIDNPEWLHVTTDADGNIIEGIKNDGKKFLFSQEMLEKYHDIEGRSEITLDNDGKIINYRNSDGVLVEYKGINSKSVVSKKITSEEIDVENIAIKNVEFSEAAKETVSQIARDAGISFYNSPNLPKYGTTNIKTETFYLSYHKDVSTIDDVYLIKDFEDTSSNANNRMTLYHYYVKNTLTNNGDGTYSVNENSVRLRHYASGKVKYNDDSGVYEAKETIRKVNGTCYFVDTLGYTGTTRKIVIEGYSCIAPDDSELANNAVNQIKVQVTPPIVGKVCINAWTVEDWDFNAVDGTDIGKKYEHNCIADIDFGHYLTVEDAPIGIKHQGNSTQSYRKRNLRYTFYKDNTYDKKSKIKIGEMLRLSGYNLKASWVDKSRIKELVLYRIFEKLWNNRPITDRYDWDNKVNGYFHGASGTIQCFPIRLNVAGEFYGIYIFGLKKDEKNYMLDGSEESGIFVSGAHNTSNDWITDNATDDYVKYHYDLEMQDEWFESDLKALKDWHNFINNNLYVNSNGESINASDEGAIHVEFNRENISERLDVLGFIDYFICLQVFVMYDNTHNNMAVYFGKDKKKFHPFFYDLDGTIQNTGKYTYDCDILADGIALASDMSLWKNIHDIYWDEIVNRYCELRKTVLSIDYIKAVFEDVASNIPNSDFDEERNKWGSNIAISVFEDKLSFLTKRIDYLDKNYFII